MMQELDRLLADRRFHRSLSARSVRLGLARELQSVLQIWNVAEVESFVSEMVGLNLRQREDRELFRQFLFCWVVEAP